MGRQAGQWHPGLLLEWAPKPLQVPRGLRLGGQGQVLMVRRGGGRGVRLRWRGGMPWVRGVVAGLRVCSGLTPRAGHAKAVAYTDGIQG